MTELEKRKKALENAKKKYPDVTDSVQLEKLSLSLEKKNTIIKSITMIIGGTISVIVSLFLQLESVTQIFMIMGVVFVTDGFFLLLTLFKKKKGIYVDKKDKTVIDMVYLTLKDKKHNISTIIKQIIGMGIAVAILFGYSQRDTALALFLLCIPLAFIGLYWFFRIREYRINQKSILEESFKIVKTKVYDKEDVRDVGTDAETTHTYSLIFFYQGRWCYKFTKDVSKNEYHKRNIGDECYLLLFLNNNKYELNDIFWSNETTISNELAAFMATEEEISNTNKRLYYDNLEDYKAQMKIKHNIHL